MNALVLLISISSQSKSDECRGIIINGDELEEICVDLPSPSM